MISSGVLLADLKKQVKLLEKDLTSRSDDTQLPWAQQLRAEYEQALARGRTAFTWTQWRQGEIAQAAVAWIIGTVFIRFAEDNGLLVGARRDGQPVSQPWLAGPGDGVERAVENRTDFYTRVPTATGREWLQEAFHVLADQPAGRGLLDPDHSPVWSAPISGDAADALITFWQRTTATGDLVHDFTDPTWDTRFLGDLYQDLSDYAKKTFALLQTPIFVEEFILDRTLTPALEEFGLEGLKIIDPTCGSGHFLLGAFARLDAAWQAHAPGMDARERVQKALNSVHGVDLNPFAVAIARFRLTVAALQAAGESTLVGAPAFGYRLAIGDSLLGGATSVSIAGKFSFEDDDEEAFEYSLEDLHNYAGILAPNQYHVVVGNPPYITVKDKALNQKYRELYSTCSGTYALSVPFMELFFRLALRPRAGSGAGYVGQITADSFMRRDFGRKLVEQFLSGADPLKPVDVTHIFDTSGVYVPGHGTPTVVIVGRSRRPQGEEIRVARGLSGEPSPPQDPSRGLAWLDLYNHADDERYVGTYFEVGADKRANYATHPWVLSGGATAKLNGAIEERTDRRVGDVVARAGYFGMPGVDDGFTLSASRAKTLGPSQYLVPLIIGRDVRDYSIKSSNWVILPYDENLALAPEQDLGVVARWLWPLKPHLNARATFGGRTYLEEGRPWYEWHQLPRDLGLRRFVVTWAQVSTHNNLAKVEPHTALNSTSPILKFSEGTQDATVFQVIGSLGSSVGAFWLKQVSQDKGNGGIGGGISDEEWERRYQFTAGKLESTPLTPNDVSGTVAQLLERAAELAPLLPAAVIDRSPAGTLGATLDAARRQWRSAYREVVALQEELDWETYAAWGLADSSLGRYPLGTVGILPNERPVEVRLAREVKQHGSVTAWFTRNDRIPVTDANDEWPSSYAELWRARMAAIDQSDVLKVLEQPQFKRRWNAPDWDEQLASSLRSAATNVLERSALWQDSFGRPRARSVSQIADELRSDSRLAEILELLIGSVDYDLMTVIADFLSDTSVPFVAARRYRDSGLAKFAEWQRVWELQRAADRGENVSVPVPPRYAPADFVKPSYWSARGKLDVPEERFISYPDAATASDTSAVYGWAGWDHAERGLALVRLANDMASAGATSTELTPLLAGLVELEPWLHQWYSEIDPAFGTSPAQAISGALDNLLSRAQLTRDDVTAWRPPAATRGRRAAYPARQETLA